MFSGTSAAASIGCIADNWGIGRKRLPAIFTAALCLGTLAVKPSICDRDYGTITQLALANLGLVATLSSATMTLNANSFEEYCSQLPERMRQVTIGWLVAIAAATVGSANYKFSTFEKGYWG